MSPIPDALIPRKRKRMPRYHVYAYGKKLMGVFLMESAAHKVRADYEALGVKAEVRLSFQ